MLARLRRRRILEVLRARGGVRLTELSEALSVSEMTIRRDLEAPQKDGLDRAGARRRRARSSGAQKSRASKKRSCGNNGEKAAIAERAAELVKPGSAVALPAGTTTWALASRLSNCEGLTVVTNSMNVWNELQRAGDKGTTVILTGGEFRTPSDALVGPTADASIRSLYFDVLFLGVHGLDPVAGLTTPNIRKPRRTGHLFPAADDWS